MGDRLCGNFGHVLGTDSRGSALGFNGRNRFFIGQEQVLNNATPGGGCRTVRKTLCFRPRQINAEAQRLSADPFDSNQLSSFRFFAGAIA
jgi:hypothetical protein